MIKANEAQGRFPVETQSVYGNQGKTASKRFSLCRIFEISREGETEINFSHRTPFPIASTHQLPRLRQPPFATIEQLCNETQLCNKIQPSLTSVDSPFTDDDEEISMKR
ncbi:hypothetical protein KOR42_19580 [Thalassoglobus neptunius]|uniref:Uncharacterized protein n=1 Tax=Thalassoglobus neptunius TaxID=1938619 RepID=A0A5C5X6C0_9PLAN|nr:hypothetical protein KOR42_19580 [Thalassoglobus neptunius]